MSKHLNRTPRQAQFISFWQDVAGPVVVGLGIILGLLAVFASACGLVVFLIRLGWRLAALVVP